jgi:hypothetical protein
MGVGSGGITSQCDRNTISGINNKQTGDLDGVDGDRESGLGSATTNDTDVVNLAGDTRCQLHHHTSGVARFASSRRASARVLDRPFGRVVTHKHVCVAGLDGKNKLHSETFARSVREKRILTGIHGSLLGHTACERCTIYPEKKAW